MDRILLTYRRLFAIEIWHDYFLTFLGETNPRILLNDLPEDYNIGQFIEIRPSAETLKIFKNFGLKYLSTATGLEVYANAISLGDNNWKTAISLLNEMLLSFELFAKTPDFFSFTNLPLSIPFSAIIYLNNRGNNNTNDGLYLSTTLNVFATDTAYHIGAIVKKEDIPNHQRIYISIADSSVNEALPDEHANYSNDKWIGFEYRNSTSQDNLDSGVQSITDDDTLNVWSDSFYYEENNPTPGEVIQFTLKDVKDQSIPLGTLPGTEVPQDEITVPQGVDIIRHKINLQHVKEGRYIMEVSGGRDTIDFYLLHGRQNLKPFGVIELYGDPLQNEYRFFEERIQDGRRETIISEKTFKIRFKNRIAKWRYYQKGDTSSAPAYTTTNPFSRNFIQVDNHLPNPKPTSLKAVMKTDKSEIEGFYADLYIYDITI